MCNILKQLYDFFQPKFFLIEKFLRYIIIILKTERFDFNICNYTNERNRIVSFLCFLNLFFAILYSFYCYGLFHFCDLKFFEAYAAFNAYALKITCKLEMIASRFGIWICSLKFYTLLFIENCCNVFLKL